MPKLYPLGNQERTLKKDKLLLLPLINTTRCRLYKDAYLNPILTTVLVVLIQSMIIPERNVTNYCTYIFNNGSRSVNVFLNYVYVVKFVNYIYSAVK